jgi:hypothetical protein
VQSSDKVIVAGDSVANGGLLNDHETLASRLQLRDRERQYINIGIGGADASDIICALQRTAKRYPDQIRELIYIYAENDLKDDKPWGTPAEVLGWLQEFVSENNIEKTTVIYAPFIYNILPHHTRFRGGYRGSNYETHAVERNQLEDLSKEAGFRYVDITDLAMAEIEAAGTQFAALALFNDRLHWSPLGSERMAEFLSGK